MNKLFFLTILFPFVFNWGGTNDDAVKNSQVEDESVTEIASCYTEGEVSFKGGEELVYKLYYNWNFVWIPAGEVVFKVQDRNDHYVFSAHGRTYQSYDRFFKVDDYFETKVDKHTLLPETFYRDVNEGGHTIYNKIEFDQNSAVLTTQKGKTKESTELKTYEYQNCMHDILSIIYYMRTLDYGSFKNKQKFPVDVYMDFDHYKLNVFYDGVEKNKNIKGLGKYDCLVVSPLITGTELFEDDVATRVYASNDMNRVPLMIESPLSVGYVKAVLKTHKGLKGNLSKK